MNGRIYDPLLGRFLSADLVVQYPGNLQSYNRYSYVRNNPLTSKDPSGFSEEDEKQKVRRFHWQSETHTGRFNPNGINTEGLKYGRIEADSIQGTLENLRKQGASNHSRFRVPGFFSDEKKKDAPAEAADEAAKVAAPNSGELETDAFGRPVLPSSNPDDINIVQGRRLTDAEVKQALRPLYPFAWNWKRIGSAFEAKGGLGLGFDARLKLSKLELGAGARVTTVGGWFNLGGGFGGYQAANLDLLKVRAGNAQIGLGREYKVKFGYDENLNTVFSEKT